MIIMNVLETDILWPLLSLLKQKYIELQKRNIWHVNLLYDIIHVDIYCEVIVRNSLFRFQQPLGYCLKMRTNVNPSHNDYGNCKTGIFYGW